MQAQRVFPFACALVLCACASQRGTAQTADSTPPATELVTTLNPIGSRVVGSVSLKPGKKAKETRAKVSLRNASVGSEHPWEIRSGRCGENGPILGARPAYRPLAARADGTADVTVTLPIALPSDQPAYVNILLSRTEPDRVVACGVLSPATP